MGLLPCGGHGGERHTNERTAVSRYAERVMQRIYATPADVIGRVKAIYADRPAK